MKSFKRTKWKTGQRDGHATRASSDRGGPRSLLDFGPQPPVPTLVESLADAYGTMRLMLIFEGDDLEAFRAFTVPIPWMETPEKLCRRAKDALAKDKDAHTAYLAAPYIVTNHNAPYLIGGSGDGDQGFLATEGSPTTEGAPDRNEVGCVLVDVTVDYIGSSTYNYDSGKWIKSAKVEASHPLMQAAAAMQAELLSRAAVDDDPEEDEA